MFDSEISYFVIFNPDEYENAMKRCFLSKIIIDIINEVKYV